MWEWWHEFVRRARQDDDRERLRLVRLYQEAFGLRETDLDACLARLREGSDLAESLGEPWFRLHFDQVHLNILLHQGGDCRAVLDLAIQNVLEVRKPQYQLFPGRFAVTLDLACTYLSIDPSGYELEIRDLLAYLDGLMGPALEDEHPYLEMQKVRLALKLGLLDEAHAAALRMLDLVEGERGTGGGLYSAYAHSLLCRIAFRQGDLESLAGWAREGVKRSEQAGEKKHHTAMTLWQAVLARKAGDDSVARRLYRRATARAARWTGLRFGGYYNALCAFHEHAEEAEDVLRVRESHWENVRGRGRLHDEAFVLTRRCDALARLGRLGVEDISRAREAACRLRRPGPVLAELDGIARR
jgi:hypothetical protein